MNDCGSSHCAICDMSERLTDVCSPIRLQAAWGVNDCDSHYCAVCDMSERPTDGCGPRRLRAALGVKDCDSPHCAICDIRDGRARLQAALGMNIDILNLRYLWE